MPITILTATTTVVSNDQKVSVKWVHLHNTGTASGKGNVQLRDLNGNVLFTGKTAATKAGITTHWDDFYGFLGGLGARSCESASGLVVHFTTNATNVSAEISYE